MTARRLLGRLAGLVVLGLFGLTTGCPGDPPCPDCVVKARSSTCGELVFTGTVPGSSSTFTAPKLSVTPASGAQQTLPLASAAYPEPWRSGTSFEIPIDPAALPSLCDGATEKLPHGDWHSASLMLLVVDPAGKEKRYRVANGLPPGS
ncbi:hypothetical protein L6R52_37485 [Myxococcota bacterium]|nr:hypothetical protein [Myxococcota bacterium]